jgi:peptidoglycan hydrolase CwlO-like protein
MQITNILKKFGLLDHEEYLVPPEHPNVAKLIQRLVKMRSIVEEGKMLTPEQKVDLKDLEAAKDYYDEALEDELALHDEDEDDEEELDDDEEEDEGDEGDEGEPNDEHDADKEIVLDDDDEEDETYED